MRRGIVRVVFVVSIVGAVSLPSVVHAALPKLSVNDVTIVEADTGTKAVKFVVRLSRAAPGKITVRYATRNGTAKAGSDFTTKTGTLRFLRGQKTKTVSVLSRGDFLDEANEKFSVGLSSPSGATLADRRGAGTITDDDGPISDLVINEVDYDSIGIEDDEFVEIYNTGTESVSLGGVALVFVNGVDSDEIDSTRVDLSSLKGLQPGQYLLIANSAVSAPFGVPRVVIPDNTVQNGNPDGLALWDAIHLEPIDVLSYEGSITLATIDGASGIVSLVEGTVLDPSVADNNTTPASLVRLPNGVDADNANIDWWLTATPTPGSANV